MRTTVLVAGADVGWDDPGAASVKEKEETTYGVSLRHLADLLAMAAGRADPAPSASKGSSVAETLEAILRRGLPPPKPNRDPLHAKPPKGRSRPQATARLTIGEALLDPGTDMAAIEALKEFGKGMSLHASSQAEKAASTVVYFAAIAHALVFHGTAITSYSPARLAEGMSKLVTKESVPDAIGDLLKQAIEICMNSR